MVLAWIHFPGLLGFLYKKWVLEEIESLVKIVAKLDIKKNIRARGQFAKMAVFFGLEKPLISQVMINERVQMVEFEALPAILVDNEKIQLKPRSHMGVVIGLEQVEAQTEIIEAGGRALGDSLVEV
ncbi:hypothetical protein Gogos_011578 [Gossypium gossypioides]|uniref:DUF4283 domain-containing protein n=1 Tax=Gossypium gossypioides TaxID=34282 RepID=A0A7J9BPR6_GOSGO|nr:hypothetical protein [Gossypium gossypioides]